MAVDPSQATLLLQALAELDRLAGLGAGSMPVLPRDVPTASQGRYEDKSYVGWPKANYAALEGAWNALGLFGRRFIFNQNASVAQQLDTNQNGVAVLGLLSTAVTVNLARAALREDLRAAGVNSPLVTAPAGEKGAFPWGWVLGVGAMGLGLGFILFVADRHAEKQLEGGIEGVKKGTRFKSCPYCDASFQLPPGETKIPPHKNSKLVNGQRVDTPCDGAGKEGE